MYRLGERKQHHSRKKPYAVLGLFAFVILVAGILVAKHYLTAGTNIKTSSAVVTKVSYATSHQQIETPNFTISLPTNWKLTTMDAENPTPSYIWQGTAGEDRTRWISVYVDQTLTELAVNRVIHVQANGAALNIVSATSDNCRAFSALKSSPTGKSAAKWENIDFLCDIGNYNRDVVGTLSTDGLNNVKLTGTKKGAHNYFFTYTDNSDHADYTIFTTALKSFKGK